VRARRSIVLGGIVGACLWLVASASGAGGIHLTEAKSAGFPERAYVLSLPAGARLQASAVKVTENGHGVNGLSVVPAGAASDVASGTVLAIDASNSMRGAPIKGAVDAARAFVARRNVNQRLAVLTFNSSTHVAVPFTVSQSAIEHALAREPQLRFQTRLYDAIAEAIAQIRAVDIGAGSIIVLSDGADVGSDVTPEQVIQSAKDAHVRIYTVGLRSKTFHPRPMQQLATATGGTFSRADSPSDLAAIYNRLGLQLAQEYILTYNSIVKPGNPVKLSVSIAGIGAANAAYVAPAAVGPKGVFHGSVWNDLWQSPLMMIVVALLVPALIAAAVLIPLRQRRSTVRARVSDYVSMPQQTRDLDAFVSRVFTGTERSLEKTRLWQRFAEALQFAEVPFSPAQVAIGTLVVTLLVMWVFWLVAGPVLALVALSVPLGLRAVVLGRIARKRRLFSDQLADNLDVLASGLRAGHSLIGALSVVVADAAEPSRSEFQHVIADEQLGVPLETALDRIVQRMRNRDLEQVSMVASVQSETGGNAAEVLDRVTESIRERQELRRLIRTLTAQGRLARWIVSLLPVGLLVAISMIQPSYMKPMFTHTSGVVALLIGLVMIVSGSVVIGRIVDIEV
jgi:tight adherence protein B